METSALFWSSPSSSSSSSGNLRQLSVVTHHHHHTQQVLLHLHTWIWTLLYMYVCLYVCPMDELSLNLKN
jgi:hypothetical protein